MMRGWHIPLNTYNPAHANVVVLEGVMPWPSNSTKLTRRNMEAGSETERRTSIFFTSRTNRLAALPSKGPGPEVIDLLCSFGFVVISLIYSWLKGYEMLPFL